MSTLNLAPNLQPISQMAKPTSRPPLMERLTSDPKLMTKLTYFSNEELENILRHKAVAERRLTLEVIELLGEVDRRKLHVTRGFGSLLEYCVRELKYSESSAYRRISAMRVVRDVPEVKLALQAGALNLNTVAQAQTFFKAEEKQKNKMNAEQKKDVLRELHGKSTRQTERLLAEISPTSAPVKNETVRAVKDERTQVTLMLSKELTEKVEKLKNHLSHRVPSGHYLDLLEYMVDSALKKFEGSEKKLADQPRREATPAPVLKNLKPEGSFSENESEKLLPVNNVKPTRSRYISMPVRRLVWKKAQGRCSHINHQTGQRCEQRKFLEIDHIHAYAKGGANTVENLQLLCDAHNRQKR